ncbi:sensor histidine kinase, partial [Neobacillus vireti]|uniref:sensor histidine kinase n=1 Tax=Neobacillus vireti TaxID=220686 RepID=UPI002FFFD1D8
ELDSINLTIAASAVEFIGLQNMLQKEWLEQEDYIKMASLKNIIDSPAIAHSYVDSIYIYVENDRSRFLTSTTGGVVDLVSFEDTDWYTANITQGEKEGFWTKKRTIVRTPANFPKKKIEVISIYRKFTLANGDPGVIVLNVNTAYLKKYLNSLYKSNEQYIIVVDQDLQILFENQPIKLPLGEIKSLVSSSDTYTSIQIVEEPSIAFKLDSEKFNWMFISTIPKAELYKLPFQLSVITLVLLLSSILVGVFVSFRLTKRNFADFRSIINILIKAEKGEPLPHLPHRVNNIHTYIIHKLLTNFMEHSYLKVLLSERKYKNQMLELAVHQAQLNPHFLYNTLETINWKVIHLTKKPNEINEMIDNLANILRYSLETNNDLVFLADEIKHTKSYVDIQKVRYKEKFTCIWEYDSDIEKYYVIKLMLQPLIENCLHHGMMESKKTLSVKIKIKKINSNLFISIIDNGAGIETEKLANIQTRLSSIHVSSDHIGLFNTHKRIQLTYGESYGTSVKSIKGWGTVVTIKIPIE